MAKTSQKLNLKRWKRKFLGINEEGADITDDVYSKAQRLINIFRQLSVLNKDAIEKYNDMLLNVSADVRSVLSTMPCGMDVRGYISYLQERRGLPIEEDDDDEDEEMMREKEKAKYLAEALSKNASQHAENAHQKATEQMEAMLNRVLSANGGKVNPEDFAKLSSLMAQNMGTAAPAADAGSVNMAAAPVAPAAAQTPVQLSVPVAIPMMRRAPAKEGEDNVVYYQDTDVSASIGKAVADAIVQSQQQTSAIISELLADALSRPQQVQNDSLKEISEMLALSQEKTANIILSSFGDAISRPQQVQNEGIKDLASSLAASNRQTVETVTSSLSESIGALASRTDDRIKSMTDSIRESNRDIIEAMNNSIRAAVSQSEEYENETIEHIASLVSASQEQTARVILDAFGSYMNRPEERRNDEIRLLTNAVTKMVEALSQPRSATIISNDKTAAPVSDEMMSRFLEAQEHNSMMLAKVIETLTGVKEEPPAEVEEQTPENNTDTELSEPLYGGFDESEFKPVASQHSEFFEINDDGYPITPEEAQGVYDDYETTYEDDNSSWVNTSLTTNKTDDMNDYDSFFAGDSGLGNDGEEDLSQIIPELPIIKPKNKVENKEQASAEEIVGPAENLPEREKEDLSLDEKTGNESLAKVEQPKSSEKKDEAKNIAKSEKDFWIKNKSKKGKRRGKTKPFVMLSDPENDGFTKVDLG